LKKVRGAPIAAALAAVATFALTLEFFPRPIHAAADPAPSAAADAGAKSYANHCAMCHGPNRAGNPPVFPSLIGVGQKMTADDIATLIHTGRKQMPPFPTITDGELTALIKFVTSSGSEAQPAKGGMAAAAPAKTSSPFAVSPAADAGRTVFQQNCAFCHGRDAMGGETGPDLTQSELVLDDKTGDAIAAVIRDGRAGKMPSFKFSSAETSNVVAFIRERVHAAELHPGGRRGVAVADLQTGNAEAGKAYFNGAGGCAKCHSPSGDLAGIASRMQGLRLERTMLYPENAKSTATVTLPSGQTISGTLEHEDEFTIAVRDSDGNYHSWLTSRVQFKVDSPVDAHVEQFPKYTDDDIHNLMAYLQTLR
jgi:mono/diheme cytochrome c family protein